jgi:type IX secretion system PorP/SprF family membrane protein
MKRYLSLLLVLLLCAPSLQAQDPQYTQFYASPLYLNPAFAGGNVCSRLATTYRNQWPSIPGAFVTYAASFDQSIPSLNSGAGLMFMNDRAGSGKLRSTSISLFYSYELQLTKKIAARIGVQGGRTVRDVNFYDLVFADQIARGGGATTTYELPTADKVAYLDISSGMLAYGKKWWAGFSSHHLNQPNQSLAQGSSTLPIKYSIHAGYNLPVGTAIWKKSELDEMYFSPVINYRAQGKFDQLDVGLYYHNNPLVLGLWYRGIPLLKAYQPGYRNDDAVSVLAGVLVNDNLRFGYSYDITVSKLISSTGGAHEVTLSYQFCNYKNMKKSKKQKPILIACPKF